MLQTGRGFPDQLSRFANMPLVFCICNFIWIYICTWVLYLYLYLQTDRSFPDQLSRFANTHAFSFLQHNLEKNAINAIKDRWDDFDPIHFPTSQGKLTILMPFAECLALHDRFGPISQLYHSSNPKTNSETLIQFVLHCMAAWFGFTGDRHATQSLTSQNFLGG